ncbi:lysophosphatidylcholine acyltransferase 2 [Python bivittatus]|uniref:Lysophosphatidylcholine acyltransferase 2 n=1 Tax=Python bivittatus TaxID=176946 RepID=A0A9F2WDZ9_PYTBI|nr:lysophosphatidylcholine acyltransferase 2 [Python bivittatus]
MNPRSCPDVFLTLSLLSQAFLLGLILLPLRAVGILLLLLMAWPFAVLATSWIPEKGTVPLQGWKRRVSSTALVFFGRALFFMMGFHVKVKGKVASPQEAPILAAAPHSSFFDSIICVVAGLPSVVSREENLLAPILGRLLDALQPVVVSRTDPDSRRHTIHEITKRATSGEQWPQVLIFPEGTCTNRSCLITFKQGAFIPAVPVQPVLVRYPNKLDTVTWTWQGYNFKQALVLTLCQFFTKVEVEVRRKERRLFDLVKQNKLHPFLAYRFFLFKKNSTFLQTVQHGLIRFVTRTV